MPHTIFIGEHKGRWDGFGGFLVFALFEPKTFARQKRGFVLRSNTRRIALKGERNG